MITLAASMFDIPGIATGAAQIGETLFFTIAAVVAMLVVYRIARQRHF